MNQNLQLKTIAHLMSTLGWSKPFAQEYLMERIYNRLGHSQAYDHAMNSVWIDQADKPNTTTNA